MCNILFSLIIIDLVLCRKRPTRMTCLCEARRLYLARNVFTIQIFWPNELSIMESVSELLRKNFLLMLWALFKEIWIKLKIEIKIKLNQFNYKLKSKHFCNFFYYRLICNYYISFFSFWLKKYLLYIKILFWFDFQFFRFRFDKKLLKSRDS